MRGCTPAVLGFFFRRTKRYKAPREVIFLARATSALCQFEPKLNRGGRLRKSWEGGHARLVLYFVSNHTCMPKKNENACVRRIEDITFFFREHENFLKRDFFCTSGRGKIVIRGAYHASEHARDYFLTRCFFLSSLLLLCTAYTHAVVRDLWEKKFFFKLRARVVHLMPFLYYYNTSFFR